MLRLATTLAIAAAMVVACGTGPVGVDACKTLETARCQTAAAKCPGISMQPPISTSGSSVDACIRYYDVACLHGLPVGDPGSTALNQCVEAIENNGCSVVEVPETDPACTWLIPPQPADAGEAGSDATADGEID
jgi:hypothetical protein